jgi:hypothetical protein
LIGRTHVHRTGIDHGCVDNLSIGGTLIGARVRDRRIQTCIGWHRRLHGLSLEIDDGQGPDVC